MCVALCLSFDGYLSSDIIAAKDTPKAVVTLWEGIDAWRYRTAREDPTLWSEGTKAMMELIGSRNARTCREFLTPGPIAPTSSMKRSSAGEYRSYVERASEGIGRTMEEVMGKEPVLAFRYYDVVKKGSEGHARI